MPKDRKLIPTIIAAAIFIILEVAALNMLRNNSPQRAVKQVLQGHSKAGQHFRES